MIRDTVFSPKLSWHLAGTSACNEIWMIWCSVCLLWEWKMRSDTIATWWQLGIFCEEAAFWTSSNLDRTRIAAVKTAKCSSSCLQMFQNGIATFTFRARTIAKKNWIMWLAWLAMVVYLKFTVASLQSLISIDYTCLPFYLNPEIFERDRMQPLILKFWSWSHFEAKHVISFPLTMILMIYIVAEVKTPSAEGCWKICEVAMRDLWFLTFQHLSRVN